MRLDYYDGIDSEMLVNGFEYQVHPRVDTLVCEVWKQEQAENLLSHQVLPDTTGWEYEGTAQVAGKKANVWVYEHWSEGKHIIYKLYAADDGAPLRWHMHGRDAIDGAHFDEWVVEYILYKPGAPASKVFDPPKHCKGVEARPAPDLNGHAYRMLSLCPAARFRRDPEYDEFSVQYGRSHASEVEYEVRKQVYYANKALIEDWNARPDATYKMALNKFADWPQEEFEAVMLPRRAARLAGQPPAGRNGQRRKHAMQYRAGVEGARVPQEVDWRGTPAEGPVPVKDQASCGSCWAFSAVGAVTAQYYLATGNSMDFSQQQLVDCSWDYDNNGCDGGLQDQAFEYVIEHGGLASLDQYQYAGEDLFCGANKTARIVQLKGYVVVPEGDKDALKEAVYSQGPLAISIDAGQPSFRFYSSGVYYEPNCLWRDDELDHAVMVTGYGSAHGEDYWMVRNSWSSYWGDDGYVLISQKGHACGVTTAAMYAVIDEAGGAKAAE